jgi:hypothetical protein
MLPSSHSSGRNGRGGRARRHERMRPCAKLAQATGHFAGPAERPTDRLGRESRPVHRSSRARNPQPAARCRNASPGGGGMPRNATLLRAGSSVSSRRAGAAGPQRPATWTRLFRQRDTARATTATTALPSARSKSRRRESRTDDDDRSEPARAATHRRAPPMARVHSCMKCRVPLISSRQRFRAVIAAALGAARRPAHRREGDCGTMAAPLAAPPAGRCLRRTAVWGPGRSLVPATLDSDPRGRRRRP